MNVCVVDYVVTTAAISPPSVSVELPLSPNMTSNVVTPTASTPPSSSEPTTTVSAQQPYQPVVSVTSQNTSSTSVIDAGIVSKLSGLLSMLPSKPVIQPTFSSSTIIPSVSSPLSTLTTPVSLPTEQQVTSEGSRTPVKDVVEERIADSVPEPQPAQNPQRVVDPIALLNQMLSQSRPSSTTSSSSVNFLQSLTMLTKTVSSSEQSASSQEDDVYMGGYGSLDSLTTTWSNTDTSPPIKALDHETSQLPATVSFPISLATESMGPPSLQSLYGTVVTSDVISYSSTASAVNTNATTQNDMLDSHSVNNSFPVTSRSHDPRDPRDERGPFSENYAFKPDFSPETSYPLPGLDMLQDSSDHSEPLQENNLTVPYLFRSADSNAGRNNLPPNDEFTERLRKKTSTSMTDGMLSPQFANNRGSIPTQTRDEMLEAGGRPPLEPPPNPSNFFTQEPVYETDAESDRYGGGFDEWEMEDHEMFPMTSNPVYQSPFPRVPSQQPPMFPRPDIYRQPGRRLPNEDFRPRFMARLPPPSAFSTLRPPPPPPPDRFQRPFFPRF